MQRSRTLSLSSTVVRCKWWIKWCWESGVSSLIIRKSDKNSSIKATQSSLEAISRLQGNAALLHTYLQLPSRPLQGVTLVVSVVLSLGFNHSKVRQKQLP